MLVCTDLAARGLDIPGRVDHIVNFDFPLTPVKFLHGHAGRGLYSLGGLFASEWKDCQSRCTWKDYVIGDWKG